MTIDPDKLSEALKVSKIEFAQFDTFGTTYRALHAEKDHAALDIIFGAAQAHERLLVVAEKMADALRRSYDVTEWPADGTGACAEALSEYQMFMRGEK